MHTYVPNGDGTATVGIYDPSTNYANDVPFLDYRWRVVAVMNDATAAAMFVHYLNGGAPVFAVDEDHVRTFMAEKIVKQD